MQVVDKSTKLTDDLKIRYSCLVHDLGKGVTPKQMLPHHYGHDEKGINQVSKFSSRIGVPTSWNKCGKTSSKWHMKGGIFEKMTPKKQVDFIEQVGKSLLGLEGLQIVVACDKNRQPENLEQTYENIMFAQIGNKCLKEINGEKIKENHPNLTGKLLGEKLHQERIKWIKSIDKKTFF